MNAVNKCSKISSSLEVAFIPNTLNTDASRIWWALSNLVGIETLPYKSAKV